MQLVSVGCLSRKCPTELSRLRLLGDVAPELDTAGPVMVAASIPRPPGFIVLSDLAFHLFYPLLPS